MQVNVTALLGGIQLLEQPVQVPKPVGARRVLQRLVLGQAVDEALADVVAVALQEVAAPVAEADEDLSDLRVGAETGLRHSAAAPLA